MIIISLAYKCSCETFLKFQGRGKNIDEWTEIQAEVPAIYSSYSLVFEGTNLDLGGLRFTSNNANLGIIYMA